LVTYVLICSKLNKLYLDLGIEVRNKKELKTKKKKKK